MRRFALLLIAVICSLALTILTIIPPVVPVDWARLDANGRYIPPLINYAWPSYGLQIALWLGILLSLWLWVREPHQAHPFLFKPHHIALLIIILIGFGLRLYALERLPLIVDEIGFAAHAADILHGQQIPIFAPGHNANPAVYSWLVSGAMSLFGQTRFAIRLIALLFGVLSIPAAYKLGQSWYGQRIGLFAAAFIATWPAHIFYSRMSLYNIVDPFFALLALAVLAHAIRQQNKWLYVMAGVLTGIAQYFYHGSRLLPVLILIYVLATGSKSIFKSGLVYGLTAFVLISLPRFAPLAVGGLPITGNVEALRLPADLSANAWRAVLAWVGQQDISPFWLSNAPLMPFLPLILFGIGMAVCLRKWLNPRSLMLIVTIPLVTIFGGAIWTAAPLYVRYLTSTPAVAMLVALGINQVLTLTPQRLRSLVGILLIVLVCGQGMVMSIQQVDEAAGNVTTAHWEADQLAQDMADLPAGEPVVINPMDWSATEIITFAHAVAAYGERRTIITR